jgi:hypothetical protein
LDGRKQDGETIAKASTTPTREAIREEQTIMTVATKGIVPAVVNIQNILLLISRE